MAYNPEEDIKVADLPEKSTDAVGEDELLIIDSQDLNILKRITKDKLGTGGGGGYTKAETDTLLAGKQDNLESGTNIKTINGTSILGSGNIEIQGGTGIVDTEMSDSSTNAVQNKIIKTYVDTSAGTKQDTLVSGTNIKTVNGTSLLGSGDIAISGGCNAWVGIENSIGQTSSTTITHNLGVTPKLVMVSYVARSKATGSSSVLATTTGNGYQSTQQLTSSSYQGCFFEDKNIYQHLIYIQDTNYGTRTGKIGFADGEDIRIDWTSNSISSSYQLTVDLIVTVIG